MQLSSISLAITRQYGPLKAFNPATLFANGEQGAWYDQSDLTTLFQDSAGTTPVTALEQPVGLMLDKRLGLVLKSELVTNGDFSTDTDWTKGSGWTISGGKAIHSPGSLSDILQANTGLKVSQNKWYVVSFSISNSTGNVSLYVGNTYVADFGNGDRTRYVYCTAATTAKAVAFSTGTTVYCEIDNISVKELPGNHAFQPTSASRPVLSARYNLLTKTEDFSDAVWNTSAGNVTLVENKLTPNATASQHYVAQGTAASGITHTIVVKAKQAGYSWLKLVAFDQYANFDLANGVVGTNFSGVSRSIIAVGGGGSYICTFTFTSVSSAGGQGCIIKVATADNASWDTANFSGNGTDGIQLYYADLRPSNDGVGLPPYQRVNTATDYDSVGFPPYLKADGVDDFMLTNSIDFTGTDKITAWAGIRKLVSQTGLAVEFSASYDANNGSFGVSANSGYGNDFGFASRGTTLKVATYLSPAPVTSVTTGIGDIVGDQTILRVNGTQVASNATDQGTGTYGNYPLYLFRRGGIAFPFNGRFYGAVIRGAQSTAAQITATEAYLNSKTKAF